MCVWYRQDFVGSKGGGGGSNGRLHSGPQGVV